jgi:hypothetical protein
MKATLFLFLLPSIVIYCSTNKPIPDTDSKSVRSDQTSYMMQSPSNMTQPTKGPCNVTVNNRWGKLYIYKVIWSSGSPTCEMMTFVDEFDKGGVYTETIPDGSNVWYKFQKTKTGGCGSRDNKFEINGIGTCQGGSARWDID